MGCVEQYAWDGGLFLEAWKNPLVKALIGGMIFEEMAKLAYGEHMPDDIIDKIKVNSK